MMEWWLEFEQCVGGSDFCNECGHIGGSFVGVWKGRRRARCLGGDRDGLDVAVVGWDQGELCG